MKYLLAFWHAAKNKWSTYLGAAVIFLPELQQELPNLFPFLPHDSFGTWVQSSGMRYLGVLIILFRIRREYGTQLQQLKTSATTPN